MPVIKRFFFETCIPDLAKEFDEHSNEFFPNDL